MLKETWDTNTLVPLYDNENSVCGISFNGNAYYFIKNLQGDIIALAAANKTIVARYSYDAWGVCTVTDAEGNENTTSSFIGNINPYRYRGYYYDVETGLYYLQSRYYNPSVGRFINGDEAAYVGISGTAQGYNLFLYCENSPIVNIDSQGTTSISHSSNFFKLHYEIIDIIHGMVEVICGKIKNWLGYIYYDVPLYYQGETNLCGAYCQIMIESYKTGKVLTQEEAYELALQLSIEKNGEENWNLGVWPKDIDRTLRIDAKEIKSLKDLYEILINNGPVYAYYDSDTVRAHLIVLTGVNVRMNIVYTNNAWGIKGKQTFEEFKKSFAVPTSMRKSNSVLKSIYLRRK